MLSILAAVFLFFGIGLLLWNRFGKYDDYKWTTEAPRYWVRGVFGVISLIITAGLTIAIMVMIPKIATEYKYQERIETVQDTNTQLEEQICAAVESYLQHEENVYEKLDITTAIGLFSAYPNLKSNELVQSLITTYQTNAAEIKSLKLEQIELTTFKFLVYLGK